MEKKLAIEMLNDESIRCLSTLGNKEAKAKQCSSACPSCLNHSTNKCIYESQGTSLESPAGQYP